MFELDMMISTFFSVVIYTLIIVYFNFKNIRRDNKTIFILFLSLFSSTAIVNTLIKVPGIRFPITIILIVLSCFVVYRLNIFESFALALISVFMLLVMDSALLWFLVKVMGFDISQLYNTSFILIANSFFLLFTVVIIFIRKFINRKNIGFKISTKLFFLACVLFIIVVCTLNLSFNNKIIQVNTSEVVIFNLIAFAVYFTICIFLVLLYSSSNSQKKLLDQQTNEYTQLIEYTTIVEKLYDDIRNQKHDFMNILFSLKGYMDNEQYDELKKYYYDFVLKEYKEKQPNLYICSLDLIQNPGLKGILSYKLAKAINDGLKVYVNIFSKIKIYGIRNLDLCKVVGILIDNAIEASLESEQKEIHIGIEKEGDTASVIIANTYLNEPNINCIFLHGYSTKDKNRGLGLFNVKETLSHYPAVQLKTSINNNTFFQELIVPDPKSPLISAYKSDT